MSHHVLLLRTPAENETEDEYHIHLATHGYTPWSIPPLDTEIRNLDQLVNTMCSPEDRFDGVIITSSRSVDAWTAAMTADEFKKSAYLDKWKGTSFYVVGSKTASLLQQVFSKTLRPKGCRIEGATESGTAEKLAEYIVRAAGGNRKRLLYLTGDKNRDTLPSKLNGNGGNIDLVPLQVYETCEDSLLSTEIREYGEEMRSGS
jgi:uroporphyrinogen-III synthase